MNANNTSIFILQPLYKKRPEKVFLELTCHYESPFMLGGL